MMNFKRNSRLRNDKILISITICVSLYLGSNVSPIRGEEKPDLYSAQDHVLRLNSKSFKPTVFHDNKNVTFVVQFYNTFCGHCQMFAPIYKELAKRTSNWTSVVRLSGVDCSKDENVEACTENKIEGYPTILIFPPNSKFQDPNDAPLSLRSLNIQWTVDDIEEAIVDYVANLTSTTNRLYPPAVNALQPITSGNMYDIKRVYPIATQHEVNDHNNIQDLMFIVESPESYLGRKLILEYYRIHTKLELRRILVSNKLLLKKILPETEYSQLHDKQPLLIRINNLDGRAKAQVLVRGEEKHVVPTLEESERQDYIYNRFRMFFEHYYSVELQELLGQQDRPNEVEHSPPSRRIEPPKKVEDDYTSLHLLQNDPILKKKIFATDLLKGISYMITHEMRVKGDLTPEEFNTVRNMLSILKKFLPLERWDKDMSKFIIDLRTRLDQNRAYFDTNGVSGQEMKDLLDFSGADGIRLRYNEENWISCYESDRQHKGYTCSLWLLFHSLTVGEYTKSSPVRSRPTLVLTTMRDYITRFLGCTVCSSNFAKETENMENNLLHRNSSVLWLWNTHNNVNQRLNNEKQSNKRPLIDVIYPSHSRCPNCYKNDPHKVGIDGLNLNDIEWNLEIVLQHMVDNYKPDTIVSPVEMKSLLSTMKVKTNYLVEYDARNSHAVSYSVDKNRTDEPDNVLKIFSKSDLNLCLIVYMTCIMTVVWFRWYPDLVRFARKKHRSGIC